MGRFSRRKPAIPTVDAYRVVLTFKDGTEKRREQILRPEEVEDYVGLFNRFTPKTGITARAIPLHCVEIDDILPAAVSAKGGSL